MAQVIWTEQASAELLEIGEYLEEYSEYYAKAWVRKIYARVTNLEKFPYMGRVVPEIGDKNIRELIEGKYRLIYELLGEDIILIQKIFHSSRNLDQR